MEHSKNDIGIIRELAKEVAEIAALPVQEEKRALWRALNGLRPKRPMVMIDQVCWNEIDFDGSLALRCENADLRGIEDGLRRTLFQWKHFPVDMVVEPYVTVPKAISNPGYGITHSEDILASEPNAGVVSHRYHDILKDDADLDKITVPEVSHNAAQTARRLELASEAVGDAMPVYAMGDALYMQLWDPISMFKGVENALYALADDPEFVHRMLARMMKSFTGMLDQLEEKGLLCETRLQTLIHCSGAYSDDLPASGYDAAKPRCKDLWIAGLAQMLSTVSPEMHQEFELDYVNPVFARFGLVYYGCCDPLDKKLDYVTKIPNLRKVSMSPWTNAERGAEGLGKRFVFSSKPNPSYLAGSGFCDGDVQKELLGIKAACDRNGCPLEFILKDISTLKHEPGRLFRWAEIAMEIAQG